MNLPFVSGPQPWPTWPVAAVTATAAVLAAFAAFPVTLWLQGRPHSPGGR
jgi:hypothetical protein